MAKEKRETKKQAARQQARDRDGKATHRSGYILAGLLLLPRAGCGFQMNT